MISRMLLVSLLALLSQYVRADASVSLPQQSVDALPPAIVYKPFNESHIVHKSCPNPPPSSINPRTVRYVFEYPRTTELWRSTKNISPSSIKISVR